MPKPCGPRGWNAGGPRANSSPARTRTAAGAGNLPRRCRATAGRWRAARSASPRNAPRSGTSGSSPIWPRCGTGWGSSIQSLPPWGRWLAAGQTEGARPRATPHRQALMRLPPPPAGESFPVSTCSAIPASGRWPCPNTARSPTSMPARNRSRRRGSTPSFRAWTAARSAGSSMTPPSSPRASGGAASAMMGSCSTRPSSDADPRVRSGGWRNTCRGCWRIAARCSMRTASSCSSRSMRCGCRRSRWRA